MLISFSHIIAFTSLDKYLFYVVVHMKLATLPPPPTHCGLSCSDPLVKASLVICFFNTQVCHRLQYDYTKNTDRYTNIDHVE